MSIRPEIFLASALSLLGGGFAGAVFTWYVSAQPTVVIYTLATTSIGTKEADVKSAVPQLKLQIGREEISALHTHSIQFVPARGPHLDTMEVGIALPQTNPPARIFGTKEFAELRGGASSPVHHIECTQAPGGFRCKMSPVGPSTGGVFRVLIATDHREAPVLVSSTKSVELIRAEELASGEAAFWRFISSRPGILGILLYATLAVAFVYTVGTLVLRIW